MKRKMTKKMTGCAMAVVLAIGTLPAGILPGLGHVAYAEDATASADSAMNVEYRTKKEIRNYFNTHTIDVDKKVTYQTNPVLTSPYQAGTLDDDTTQSALELLNFLRYIAGIDSNVTVNEDYMQLAQAAALVNSVNDQLSHYPAAVSDMDEDLYNMGCAGARSSNLAWGYFTLNRSLLGNMCDGASSNISRVGHRRWILDPYMKETGFGATDKRYYALYAFDRQNSSDYHGVAWPAQTMPLEYFETDCPWSISFGKSVSQSVQVKLTNLTTNQVWNFSSTASDGEFYVNNDGYGQPGCVIFRPDNVSYQEGDVYQVELTNLGIAGMEDSLTYNVEFFKIQQIAYGDVNSDGAVTLMDSALIRRFLSGRNVTINEKKADVNGDGNINIMDSALIIRSIAGWNVTLRTDEDE